MTRINLDAPESGAGDLFFEWSLDLLAVADFTGRFIRVNPSWQRVLGWPPEDLLARPFLDFVHPEDRAATLEQSRRITEEGEACFSFVNRYSAQDGSYRWLHWTSRPLPGMGLVFAIARDITAQKAAEAALQESEERLRLALRASRMGIWEWESTRGTVKITQGVERWMGLDSGVHEWPLEQFVSCLHPEDLDQGRNLVRKAPGDFDWIFRVQEGEGATQRLRTQGRAVSDLHGHPVRVLGTVRRMEDRD